MMLGIRFVNFDYCIGDSLITLAAVLAILVFVPSIAAVVPPVFLIPLHFAAFLAVLFMTTQRPEMGNGGLYSFAYIYLTGNPVFGEALVRRALLALAGYLICGAILAAKHRDQHRTTRFHHVVQRSDLSASTFLWQLRMALGVSLALTVGQAFGVERFMWMGFACASLLSEYPYSSNTMPRFRQRIVGVIAGSCAFFIFYLVTPEALHPLMGPLGGLCLGFCTDYRYKTAMNCFGALMLGTGIYGLTGAVILRVADTLLGVVLGLAFAVNFSPAGGSPVPAGGRSRVTNKRENIKNPRTFPFGQCAGVCCLNSEPLPVRSYCIYGIRIFIGSDPVKKRLNP